MNFFTKLYIFLFTLFLFSSVDAAEKSVVILDIDNTPERKSVTLEDTVNFFIDTAKYFDTQYPGDKINQDFHDDVAKHFPGSSPQEVYNYQRYIRSGINIYRFAKNLFNRYVEARLTPEEPPLIVKDDEYDLSSPDIPYIESQNDEAVIIQDFKKVISYSNNPREIKAYRAKLSTEGEKKGKLKDFEELGYIFSKLDFKKIFFYNIFYGSPLTGNRGIGKWDIQKDVKLRLITVQTGINENQKIEGVIHIILPPKTFITAVDNRDYFKPQINFENSGNLKTIDFTLPLPQRLKNMDKDWTVYIGEIAFPFTAEVKDPNQNLLLNAEIKLNLCNQNYLCEALNFNPELELKTGYNRDSSVATYIRMVFNFLKPLPQSELKIVHFISEKNADNRPMLTAVFDSPEPIETFSTFIGNSNQISFERPRISIDGKTVIVRWRAVDSSVDLENIAYELTAEVNQKYILRQNLIPVTEKMPIKSSLKPFLIILLLAFICGLFFNFMPTVLPLWLLKISSLSGFGFQENDSMRKNLFYTFLGIAFSFTLLVIFAIIYSKEFSVFYWGTQLQTFWFVIPATFLVLTEIAHGWGLINIPVFSQQLTAEHQTVSYFLSGILITVASFFITVPFAGEVFGYVTQSSWWQATLIFSIFFIGFTAGYIILLIFPRLLYLIPAPGPWIKKFNNLALTLLYFALLWSFFVVCSMSTFGFCFRFVFYVLFFWLFLGLRYLAHNLDYEDLAPEMRKIAAKKIGSFFAVCALTITLITLADAFFAVNSHKQQLAQNDRTTIDEMQIQNFINLGETVFVIIDADWSPICRYNQWLVLNNPTLQKTLKNNNVRIVRTNWMINSEQTKVFMKKFHQYSLPAYILFSPLVPDGLILPQILNAKNLSLLVDNISLAQPSTGNKVESKPNS